MTEPPPRLDDFSDLIKLTIMQLEEDDSTLLSSKRVEALLDSTRFMRTSSKNMSGVFVDDEGRTRIIRLLGQIAEDVELMGSLKFTDKNEVILFSLTFNGYLTICVFMSCRFL